MALNGVATNDATTKDMGQRLLNTYCCQLLETIETDTMYVGSSHCAAAAMVSDVVFGLDGGVPSFLSARYVLVFELVSSDVLSLIVKHDKLNENEVGSSLRQPQASPCPGFGVAAHSMSPRGTHRHDESPES